MTARFSREHQQNAHTESPSEPGGLLDRAALAEELRQAALDRAYQFQQRRAAAARTRAAFAANRAAGLRQRHARKERR